jgi:hypothetical protein
MFWIDLFFSALLAFLLSMVLVGVLRWRHPARDEGWIWSFLFLFVILWLSMWGASRYLVPWGPELWGVYWIPVLVVGIAVSLIALASTGARRARARRRVDERKQQRSDSVVTLLAAFGGFFWLLVLALLWAVLTGYGLPG